MPGLRGATPALNCLAIIVDKIPSETAVTPNICEYLAVSFEAHRLVTAIEPRRTCCSKSSSGVSRSLASADSAASVGTAFSAWESLSDRRNACSLSRSCSGNRSSSRAMTSRVLMPSC